MPADDDEECSHEKGDEAKAKVKVKVEAWEAGEARRGQRSEFRQVQPIGQNFETDVSPTLQTPQYLRTVPEYLEYHPLTLHLRVPTPYTVPIPPLPASLAPGTILQYDTRAPARPTEMK